MEKAYRLTINTYEPETENLLRSSTYYFKSESGAHDELNKIVVRKCKKAIGVIVKKIFGDEADLFLASPDPGPNFPYEKLHKALMAHNMDIESDENWDYEIKEITIK